MHRYLWLPALLACQSGLSAQEGGGDEFVEDVDDVPPVVDHEPITDAQPFGEDVTVTATVTDDGEGVFMVMLYYKGETGGPEDWHSVTMIANGDLYSGTISGDDESGAGMDYYIEATDKAQNVTTDPQEGADDPYHVRLY